MYSRKTTLALLLVVSFLVPLITIRANGYATDIQPSPGREVEIRWAVHSAPSSPFSLYWTGGGICNVTNDSWMFFTVIDIDDDVTGELILGNTTVSTNDTMIARDLVFGVWGLTEWWPGLIVNTGEDSISQLNETAYAAAERVAGNYLNGTMVSYFDNVIAFGVEYECIIFEYTQDPPSFGEPQETYLAYSLETGILIRGNTSYSFGTPYTLEVEYSGLTIWTGWGLLDYAVMGVILVLLIGVVVLIQKKTKKPQR